MAKIRAKRRDNKFNYTLSFVHVGWEIVSYQVINYGGNKVLLNFKSCSTLHAMRTLQQRFTWYCCFLLIIII